MKITSSEQTALRCMMQLAQNGQGVMSVVQIASQEQMAEPFTAKILAKLRRSGLIRAVRGRSGGYALAHSAKEINVAKILEAVAKPLFNRSTCVRSPMTIKDCSRAENCALRPVWDKINGQMFAVLEKISLDQLLIDEKVMKAKLASIN